MAATQAGTVLVSARAHRIGAIDPYPASRYPNARDTDEETFYRHVHYLAGFLYQFGAGDDVLDALNDVFARAVDSLPEPGRTGDQRQASPSVKPDGTGQAAA